LRFARKSGFDIGGFAPHTWETEDGLAPWLASFGLVEHRGGYRDRTEANVRDADATLIFLSEPIGPGPRATRNLCLDLRRAFMMVVPGVTTPSQVAEWIRAGAFDVVNVVGSRESRAPGSGGRTEMFLSHVFVKLRRLQ
jgi:hypothetical protein